MVCFAHGEREGHGVERSANLGIERLELGLTARSRLVGGALGLFVVLQVASRFLRKYQPAYTARALKTMLITTALISDAWIDYVAARKVGGS